MRLSALVSSAAATGILVAASLVASPEAANAASHTSASACLDGYSGPYDYVNQYGGVTLYCGDHTKGILHIDDAHPIAENGADDVNIVRCMNNIISYGTSVSASSGNSARRITRRSGGYAQIVWINSSKNVLTMYTSDGAGNNWAACASFA